MNFIRFQMIDSFKILYYNYCCFLKTTIKQINTFKLKHHKKKTFQDEYFAFLIKYNAEYDERYLWY